MAAENAGYGSPEVVFRAISSKTLSLCGLVFGKHAHRIGQRRVPLWGRTRWLRPGAKPERIGTVERSEGTQTFPQAARRKIQEYTQLRGECATCGVEQM